MTFFSANLFAGGGYARAKRSAALVRGADATAEEAAEATRRELDECDAVLVGAGAGLSAAAGFSYSGKRFDENFADFRDRFGITDMYSGGFHPFPDLETYWAWWSRAILLNRYEAGAGKPYLNLLRILEGRDYFVLTTNVDHQFQLAGFDKARLFYTQGDYGLFQCARNCSGETYDNERQVREMAGRQKDQRVPTSSFPAAHAAGRLWSPTCVSTELSARTADGTRRLPATARSARHTPAIASCIWSWASGTTRPSSSNIPSGTPWVGTAMRRTPV